MKLDDIAWTDCGGALRSPVFTTPDGLQFDLWKNVHHPGTYCIYTTGLLNDEAVPVHHDYIEPIMAQAILHHLLNRGTKLGTGKSKT